MRHECDGWSMPAPDCGRTREDSEKYGDGFEGGARRIRMANIAKPY